MTAGAFAPGDRLDFGDDLFGFCFAGGDVSFQGFLEQIALFGVQRFALGAEADAAQVGEFQRQRVDLGFGMQQAGVTLGEGCIEPEGFGSLVLELFEQYLNGVSIPIGLAVIGRVEGVGRGRFRARIHALNFTQ